MFALFVTGGREKVIFDTWAGVKVNWAVGHKKIKVAEGQGWEPRASGLRAMDRGKVFCEINLSKNVEFLKGAPIWKSLYVPVFI